MWPEPSQETGEDEDEKFQGFQENTSENNQVTSPHKLTGSRHTASSETPSALWPPPSRCNDPTLLRKTLPPTPAGEFHRTRQRSGPAPAPWTFSLVPAARKAPFPRHARGVHAALLGKDAFLWTPETSSSPMQVMHSGQEYHRSDAVSFSGHHMVSLCLIPVEATGICYPVSNPREMVSNILPQLLSPRATTTEAHVPQLLKPVSHKYRAHVPLLLKPTHLEPVLHNKRSHRNEKPAHRKQE
ncbi:hypothetical protein J1605_008362 [Eschrichtius robustus]|uniref:Uncharacterized protein n=1 Tax=Eschrichtius robustus TaxID=9764 RepID=A0AB34GZJ4_ESCRO|nr:hypothetical protein J1605_008362 [Eschrichtius robustus]